MTRIYFYCNNEIQKGILKLIYTEFCLLFFSLGILYKECMNKISSLSSIWKFIYCSTYYTPNCICSNIYYLIVQQSNTNFNYQVTKTIPGYSIHVKEAYLSEHRVNRHDNTMWRVCDAESRVISRESYPSWYFMAD